MAIIEHDGLPARDKWMALEQNRELEPCYWLTLRCPHAWLVNAPLDRAFWPTHSDAAGTIADIWEHFRRSCHHCWSLEEPPDLAALIRIALDRRGVAVFRSPEELVKGAAHGSDPLPG